MGSPKDGHRYRRTRLLAAAAAFALLCAAAGWAGYTAWRLLAAPLPPSAARMTFTVSPGESVDAIARRLAHAGVLTHAWDLALLARVRGEAGRVQAGEYRVAAGMSVADLLAMLVQGRVLMHPFTIVPGTTFAEMRSALASDPQFRNDLKGLASAAVMRLLGHPGESPAGRFFPNTYFFPRGTPDSAVLARAYSAMQRILDAQWTRRATNLPLHKPYQALILASIIEKETAVADERVKIAGVFVRRLRRGMHLDADPTVIYGLGAAYHGKLTRADLHKETPYNTYLHRGLPPTPICMPGLAAIAAALHPAPGSALYFVAKGDGTHVFSDTLAEQQKMIQKYELDRKGGSGKDGGQGTVHHP